MYKRLISLSKSSSFFLFGQRGTGKSSLLRSLYQEDALNINLLDTKQLLPLRKNPWKLREIVRARKPNQEIVVIDEIQKIPELLDEVHLLIEEDKVNFALTGSSARKLKKNATNLLGGRAHSFKLYPLTYKEIGSDFNLEKILKWGSLPKVVTLTDEVDKEEYLYSYVNTYLKEEIIAEQVIRQVDPFIQFLEIAAQQNGNNVVYENITKDTGVSSVTIKTYYQILEDTLIGFSLPAFSTSIRKRQKKSPKFYFYDIGLTRTLQNTLKNDPIPKTFEYGLLFESFIINEIIRYNEYSRSRFNFSHIKIDESTEVDLVIEKPNGEIILVEIKSTEQIAEHHVKGLSDIYKDFIASKIVDANKLSAICISRDETRRKIGDVLCVGWREGVEGLFQVG